MSCISARNIYYFALKCIVTIIFQVNTANGTNMKEETAEGHQKTELLRAKQDMMNRIIQMGEKVYTFH